MRALSIFEAIFVQCRFVRFSSRHVECGKQAKSCLPFTDITGTLLLGCHSAADVFCEQAFQVSRSDILKFRAGPLGLVVYKSTRWLVQVNRIAWLYITVEINQERFYFTKILRCRI